MHTFWFLWLAALAELFGCYAFWLWIRLHQSNLWGLCGLLSLVTFAWLLTRVEVPHAGKVYAAYGGVYLASSLLWLWWVEGIRPSLWDVSGVGLALFGTLVILIGTARP